jgi:hypothetical protein
MQRFIFRFAVAQALALGACGGGAPRPDAPLRVEATHVTPGVYLEACVRPDALRARSPWSEAQWALGGAAAGEPAGRVGPLGPARFTVGTPCQGSEVTLAPGSALTAGARRITLTATSLRVEDAATGGLLAERSLSGAVHGLTWSSGWLIAATDEGLYRGRLGEALRRVGGDGIATGPLLGVFRDGDALWVRSASGQAQPIAIGAFGAEPLAPAGVLPALDARVRAPVASGRVEGLLGAEGLRMVDPDGLLATALPTPPLEVLLPLDAGERLITVAGRELMVWRVRGLALEREVMLPLPGVTRAALVIDDATWVVAGDYGVVTLRRF